MRRIEGLLIGSLVLAEYDDRDTETVMAETYRELEWIRLEKHRKPGWTSMSYRELFGAWPEWWMKNLTPHAPSQATERAVRRKEAAYKRELKKRNGDARGKVSGSAAEASKKNRSP